MVMPVYRGHYGAGLGNVLAGVARQAIPLIAPFARRIGSSLINRGLSALYNVVGGPRARPAAAAPLVAADPRSAAAATRPRRAVKRRKAGRVRSDRVRRRSKRDILD